MSANYSILMLVSLISCNSTSQQMNDTSKEVTTETSKANTNYSNVSEIPIPAGFSAGKDAHHSFAAFLLNLGLKKDNTVFLFNGEKKVNQNAQLAVLDVSVDDQDLQQCADAVMRLRAEYLFSQQRFNDIVFYDNNNNAYQFTQPFDRAHFNKYLLKVFGACGSASLSRQLNSTPYKSIKAGDVFIHGGFPGHAVLVINVVKNVRGQTKFLLAQSYMPAQDIHILKNPLAENNSPWYDVDSFPELRTPEYTFKKTELKSWD